MVKEHSTIPLDLKIRGQYCSNQLVNLLNRHYSPSEASQRYGTCPLDCLNRRNGTPQMQSTVQMKSRWDALYQNFKRKDSPNLSPPALTAVIQTDRQSVYCRQSGQRLGECFPRMTKGGGGLSILRVIYILWYNHTKLTQVGHHVMQRIISLRMFQGKDQTKIEKN